MDCDIEQEKARFRRDFLKRRKALPADEREGASRRILEYLVAWPVYRSASVVHCFVSLSRNAEVDTGPIIDRMVKDGKQVVVPRSIPGTRKLEHRIYPGRDGLQAGNLGIPEPTEGDLVDPNDLDLVLVPLLAADRDRNRLGYGLGYYDRFLSGTTARKAGLLFSASLSEEQLPVSEYDVTLDFLITEEGII